MKNFTKKLSALVLTTVFASMQISYATIDTGLGGGLGGAEINNTAGGFVDITKGNNSADLNFDGHSIVNWNSLNLNSNETLNFNAVNGANGLTVLNTVNGGMSTIYGQINANSGIGKLIISNPNGVLFDGAKFTTVGDAMITTKDMTNISLTDLSQLTLDELAQKGQFTQIYNGEKLIAVKIKNSDFQIGGDYNIVAPGIVGADSTINAKTLKLVTANGQDYLALGVTAPTKDQTVTRLNAMNINGDLYITNDAGAMEILNGGTFGGKLTVNTEGNVKLNSTSGGKMLVINGDTDITSNGAQMFLRNAKVDGNLKMENGGGFLDVGNLDVTKNAELITTNKSTNKFNGADVKHFTHVLGKTNINGDLKINSKDNIHIGGYDYDAQTLASGKLTVGKDLVANSQDGHITTTIDTSANKISMTADNLNILTDGKATLSANEYEFSSKGYIGGLTATENYTADQIIIGFMESYKFIPNSVKNAGNVNIAGGNITRIETQGVANILSKGDVKLTGANAKQINLTAPDKYIEIVGENVHADNITIGKETKILKVDFPKRDYTLKYTNIRDEQEVIVNKDEVITYELTNDINGYNDGIQIAGKSTYLVGPDKPVTPPPTPPVDPDPKPDPEPKPDPQPDPEPQPEDDVIIPDDNSENIKVLRSFENQSVNMQQVYTPVAYAADLDDDGTDTGVRKNVDGSVTVVRAYPMGK